jgi:hypothetical protein
MNFFDFLSSIINTNEISACLESEFRPIASEVKPEKNYQLK